MKRFAPNPNTSRGAAYSLSMLPIPQLTLYTRSGCSLCQTMEEQLVRLSREGLFTLVTVDLEEQPSLESRFGEWVPVLMAGETEICHYHLDETALRNWLSLRVMT